MEYPNWFKPHSKNFEYGLSRYSQIPNLNFLQIGAYTGDASEWILENILTDPTSTLTDVDTWEGSDEPVHKSFNWSDLESFYDKRMSKFSNIKKYKGRSLEYLQSCNEEFDFIYIDGDHTAEGVYQDAVYSFPLLKRYGILAFDDYQWKHDTKNIELEPKLGIDKFLEENKDNVEIIINNYQVWIKSIKK
jgi:predicted O-methyltransferase YrrM